MYFVPTEVLPTAQRHLFYLLFSLFPLFHFFTFSCLFLFFFPERKHKASRNSPNHKLVASTRRQQLLSASWCDLKIKAHAVRVLFAQDRLQKPSCDYFRHPARVQVPTMKLMKGGKMGKKTERKKDGKETKETKKRELVTSCEGRNVG